jgi:glucosamine 6-phosphate synthetase-like amidotransferase/phosphosugar isomerase protein
MENAMLPNDCYRNYMPKEIFEEPTVVRKTIDEHDKAVGESARGSYRWRLLTDG